MKTKLTFPRLLTAALPLLAATQLATAAPKFILISLDGATPRLVEQYLASGDLPANQGLGLLQSKGFKAKLNQTVSPSLTAVGHVAIATGSKAAKNDVIANSFHLDASPFTANISGFGAPIGGYGIDGPIESPLPTAEPIWLRLRMVGGKKVVTATWPGGDGVDVRVPGAINDAIVQPASERTVDYTVPFGAFAGVGAQGFNLITTSFGAAPADTISQLASAGKTSFSPVLQKTAALETLVVGGVTYVIDVAALDTSNDSAVNYDTLVFFARHLGIQPGPFALPSTGPAYVKASEQRGSYFYFEGSSSKAGCAYYVSKLEADLSVVRISRTSANAIPRNAAVLADVDDVNNNVGFWAPQPDFRIVERISPGYTLFPDLELEEIYADLVRGFTDYQARLALHAISRVPDADLVMLYFEQPDGSAHQFLLVDPRQPTDFTNPNSIGAGQDPAKVARYANYLKQAYQTANAAVQRIINAVGVDAEGKPQRNIIVTSDHGFDPFHTAVNLNALLTSAGIPSTKVRAVTSGPAVNLYINLTNREPNGIASRAEYVALQKQLITLLQGFNDTNATYTLGEPAVSVFDKIYPRPLPADLNDPSFGRGTSEFIGQDSGDVYALLRVGYNFDGTQTPVVIRQGDPVVATPILSLLNFYGAHGYDPTLEHMSSIFFAAGPDIGTGTLPSVQNIDIAPTIAKMLNVETYAAVDGKPLPIEPLEIIEAVSRKHHGRAGVFDLPLPVTWPIGVEGRKSDWHKSHTLLLTFNKNLVSASATVNACDAAVASSLCASNQLTVRLVAVNDEQVVTLNVTGTDVFGGTVTQTLRFGVLLGDVNGDGRVNRADKNLVEAFDQECRRKNKYDVTPANFRADVNTNGRIDEVDEIQVRLRFGNVLP